MFILNVYFKFYFKCLIILDLWYINFVNTAELALQDEISRSAFEHHIHSCIFFLQYKAQN